MLRNYLLISVFFGIITLVSCGPSGPKPDKRIVAQLELEDASSSESTINSAIAALQHRFKKFNAFPTIERLAGTNTIEFSLDTHADPDRILKFLKLRGHLEFYPLLKKESMQPFMDAADELLKEHDSMQMGPLRAMMMDPITPFATSLCRVAKADTTAFHSFLKMNKVLGLLESDMNPIKFLWGLPEHDLPGYPLYAVRTNDEGQAPLDGSSVVRSQQSFSYSDRPVIDIQMDGNGSKIWEEMTGEAYQNSSQIAIVIDDVVYTAPGVTSGPIMGGRSEIMGDFTEKEAQDLAAGIGSGRIPKMKILNHSVVALE